ncbi:hypothetical protein [Paraburkholderia elongata]|uniref:Uncharacterized protein n=1 Tax=Paraburkholderia elongata TaxID=2675747 RepID=A0A972SNV9_9BURK|nr:hypothetical protein [Paraburkholderia elongata]NPT61647.1 hypothetical protein [Paraburkholderia elongata]
MQKICAHCFFEPRNYSLPTPPIPPVPAQPIPDNGIVLPFEELSEGQTATLTVDAMASSILNIAKLEEWNIQRPVLVAQPTFEWLC